jgi:hypothetical protein
MKPIMKGAAALLIMLALGGCDRVQKAARDLTGDDGDTGKAPAAAGHSTTSYASSSSSSRATTPSASVAVTDPSDSELGDWHIAMTAACAAGKAQHVAHDDINGDGLPDTVCWNVKRTKDHGDFVEVDARVRAGDREQSAYRLIWVRPGEAMGLCAADHVSVKQTLWAQKDLDQRGWGVDHRIGLTIANDGCTPVRLFWPGDAIGDEVDFRYERN